VLRKKLGVAGTSTRTSATGLDSGGASNTWDDSIENCRLLASFNSVNGLTTMSFGAERARIITSMRSEAARTTIGSALFASLGALVYLTRLPAAAVIDADPSNYRTLIRRLKPGDTLRLAAGTYRGLAISNINGSENEWITITGPADGPPAVMAGEAHEDASGAECYMCRKDVIDIWMSSYIAIENLRIDSRGIAGAFGIAAHGLEENIVHHIRVEGNTFVGQGGNQQTDAISTKIPTWGWVIRYNRIMGAGTGMYLGHSDGSQPFVAGLIENNLIRDTIGYNIEIKHQRVLPEIEGMPLEPTSTIIRNNVFVKNDRPSPDGDRPNVLVSGFPATGHGSLNTYEIYGNVFLHNHREALLQASGRVSVHDNLFVDGPYNYPAVLFRQHNRDPVQVAYFYNNTVYTTDTGVQFGSRATVDDAVVGNLIFGSKPISGQILRQEGNIVDTLPNARLHVKAPSFDLGTMDFYPLARKCSGPAIDLSAFAEDAGYTSDFNGLPKVRAAGAVVYRGAYAASGANPGWKIEAGVKPPHPPAPAAAPVLIWVSPANVPAGRSIQVKLTGANFAPDATVSVSGEGVTVAKASVDSPSVITATLSASAAGAREITIKQQSGASNRFKLTISAARR
jgi:hypothetical protein